MYSGAIIDLYSSHTNKDGGDILESIIKTLKLDVHILNKTKEIHCDL